MAEGISSNGHIVDVFDMNLEMGKIISFYDYVVVISCATSYFSKNVPSNVAKFLKAAGTNKGSHAKAMYGLDSLEKAIELIKNRYYTDAIDIDPTKGDAEFKRLLTEIQKAGDNDNVGKSVIRFKGTVGPNGKIQLDHDPLTGALIRAKEWEKGIALEEADKSNALLDSADQTLIRSWFANPANKASYSFDSKVDLATAQAFFKLKKSMKNFAPNIEAQKAAELANVEVTINTFNDATGAVTGTTTKSVNQVLGMIDKENKISEQAQKSQKLTADALQGIKVADEAVKKHRANSKRPKPNGGGGGH